MSNFPKSDEMEYATPGCSSWLKPARKSVAKRWGAVRNFLRLKRRSKEKSGSKPKQPKPISNTSSQKAVKKNDVVFTEVAGEEVTVNVFHEDTELPDIEARPETPEDDTFAFLHNASTNRVFIVAVIRELGRQLLDPRRSIQGDKDGWREHMYTTKVEIARWKERCRASHAHFAKTREVIGELERERNRRLPIRIQNYFRRKVIGQFRSVVGVAFKCPCFGRG